MEDDRNIERELAKERQPNFARNLGESKASLSHGAVFSIPVTALYYH
jgi:hypothetical protein